MANELNWVDSLGSEELAQTIISCIFFLSFFNRVDPRDVQSCISLPRKLTSYGFVSKSLQDQNQGYVIWNEETKKMITVIDGTQ